MKPHAIFKKFADKFSIDEDKVATILKAAAFKVKNNVVSDEQLVALLIVADQYNLNPFTREIFAYPDKQNGIVPVVSVDGWSRIVNSHIAFDGVEYRYSDATVQLKDGSKLAHEWIECVTHRKDRTRPHVVREYFDEVYRPPTTFASPWQSHTKRMHRHKAFIQCCRIAFGFAGIYDQDEAERIIEGQSQRLEPETTASPETVTVEAEVVVLCDPDQVNDITKAKIARVLKRAWTAGGVWESCAGYFKENFQGNDLAYANAELQKAKQEYAEAQVQAQAQLEHLPANTLDTLLPGNAAITETQATVAEALTQRQSASAA
jgi:phage recombination protein Bet